MSRKKTVQSSITSMEFPLLQKSGEMCPVRQINVSGKFWNLNRDRLCDDETNKLFKCTVHGHHVSHKWAGGRVPSQTKKLQEMGVDKRHSEGEDIIWTLVRLARTYVSREGDMS